MHGMLEVVELVASVSELHTTQSVIQSLVLLNIIFLFLSIFTQQAEETKQDFCCIVYVVEHFCVIVKSCVMEPINCNYKKKLFTVH